MLEIKNNKREKNHISAEKTNALTASDQTTQDINVNQKEDV